MRQFRFSSVVVLTISLAASLAGAAEEPASEKKPEPGTGAEGRAVATEVLVFGDGDRTRGRMIGRDGEFIIFHSDRFGELRIPTETVEVQPLARELVTAETGGAAPAAAPAEGLPSAPQAFPTEPESPAQAQQARLDWTSPAALSEAILKFLGPWTGRFGLSLSLTSDSNEGKDVGGELSFAREWENDEVSFSSHYYRSKTDDVVDTDLFKGNGLVQHDFSGRPFFVSYRPSIEWNRAHTVRGAEADYVLLQEAFGVGVKVFDQKGRKVRIGVAENVFNLWTLDQNTHSLSDTQSAFLEYEFALPWRITLSGRNVWFYSFATGDHGREDLVQLTKKFSDTLSLGIRHASRENNPDERIADYSLLRFQMGFDF